MTRKEVKIMDKATRREIMKSQEIIEIKSEKEREKQ